jgi:hypothetical protein
MKEKCNVVVNQSEGCRGYQGALLKGKCTKWAETRDGEEGEEGKLKEGEKEVSHPMVKEG